jgi:hypothetical protein
MISAWPYRPTAVPPYRPQRLGQKRRTDTDPNRPQKRPPLHAAAGERVISSRRMKKDCT